MCLPVLNPPGSDTQARQETGSQRAPCRCALLGVRYMNARRHAGSLGKPIPARHVLDFGWSFSPQSHQHTLRICGALWERQQTTWQTN